ncbi:MAG TPA: beta-ketoacyl synthase N-terminal-like domain-containing protein [Streptosporangiaceae bacterium]|nr:beta-ketoacyl synthase N-terminal-like domain-containing protein [Streptosporangiaceae bacterium]
MTDVAIVGVGAVFPGAGDAPAFWRNIVAGVDAVGDVPPGRWDPEVYYQPDGGPGEGFYCRRGGFVDDLADFDAAEFGIMPAAVHAIEPDQLLVLRAAAEAIADSGGLGDTGRVGVVIGRGGYLTPGVARLDQRVHVVHQLITVLRDLVPGLGEDRLAEVADAFRERLGGDGDPSSIGLVPNFAASRIANRFDLRGPAYTVDAACASSLVAVDHAVADLASRRCDAVLAGGVHTCHHPTLWSVFTQLRALSSGGVIRPFDARADGTLLSEGAGVVVLKRFADATAAGDRVYAVIRGVGVASDGRATSMMNPLAEGQELAIRRAWSAAGLDPLAPDAIGLLEAHGTATVLGDEVELTTVARVFGPPGSAPMQRAGLGTVKSMIGHAMPAAGAAGLIKAALAVHHGVLPPTLHIGQPHPGLAWTRFEPVTAARPWDEGLPRRAAVNAFGFGGINAHVILEAPATRTPTAAKAGARRTVPTAPGAGTGAEAAGTPPAIVVTTDPAEPILRLAAGSPRELARSLDAPDADLLARAGSDPSSGHCRLAVVAPDPRRLALARKVAARGTPWRGRSDIWFTSQPLLSGPEQVAFLFPGFEPEFTPEVVDTVAATFGLPVPALHGSDTAAGPDGGVVELARDVVAVGRLLAAALARLGVTPGVLAGHSLGEWTAMIVGGVFPEVDEFIASVRPGMVEVPDLVYAALGTQAGQVARFLGADLGDVVVSHDNCPHQCVVCGPASQVSAVAGRARAAGVLVQELPFRTGFHSPMFAPYLAAARETQRRLAVHPAHTPVWSATSLAPFPADPGQVRELVLRHLVERVRFRELTLALHSSGVRAFVQVGMGSLTGFADDTLRDHDHLSVAAAVPQRDGLAQLRRAIAALWVEGLAPRFDLLGRPAPHRAPVPPLASTGARRGVAPGSRVKLRLGAPLVRLTGVAPLAGTPLASAVNESHGNGTGLPAGSPVLAELNAVMAEAAAVTVAVTQAMAHAPAPVAPAGAATTREFSLATMPEIADHCLMPQAQGWPDDSDRFPVVPMTTLLDVMAQAAAEAAPGRVVTGFEQVSATRWLAIAPATRARVHATPDGTDRVRVRIEGYANGVVLVRDAYLEPPPPDATPLRGMRPAPVTAQGLYAGRWMFHGPRFAGVTDITSLADDGITGQVASLPTRGALLDSAGQLIGHWMQVSRTVNQTVLPTGIRAVLLYGPQPPVGERLGCTAWVREVSDTQMRADAELRTADGRVWCRIEGWTTHRFATDDTIWRVKFRPEKATLSRPGPDGTHVLWERWPDSASRELIMRRYLNAAERAEYGQLNPREQRLWLLRRIAAKDCVRRWLWDRGAGPMYPAEVTVEGNGDGLRGRGPFRAPPVWLAHHPGAGTRPACVVATAADGQAHLTLEATSDGRLVATRPGHAPWAVDAAAADAAPTAKGH